MYDKLNLEQLNIITSKLSKISYEIWLDKQTKKNVFFVFKTTLQIAKEIVTFIIHEVINNVYVIVFNVFVNK
jgi:hypothetical protein